MKDTFILKTEWKSIVDDLADRQAGVLIKAVFEYIATGDKPELQDGEVKMAFKFMKMSIDAFQEKYQAKIKANQENGKGGGAPKGNQNARKQNNRSVDKTTENNRNNPKQHDTDSESDSESDSELRKPPPRAREDFSKLPADSDSAKEPSLQNQRFAVFWQAYPKRRGIGDAERAFRKIKPSQELLEKMLVAIDKAKWSDDWTRENGRFIPNPSTWLNQRRWEDDPPPPKKPPDTGQVRQTSTTSMMGITDPKNAEKQFFGNHPNPNQTQ